MIPVESIRDALSARQRLEGDRRDELCRVLCHDHVDFRMLLDETAREVGGLIGGNTACDAEQNGFSLQHIPFPFQVTAGQLFLS